MKQLGYDQDWWSITSIHEAAHGIVAFVLDCSSIELKLNRREAIRSGNAGVCYASYERSWFGDVAKIYVQNAPFVAHQYECLPCGDKGDLHERQEAFEKFCEMAKMEDQEVFRKLVDEPLLTFFGDSFVQAATIHLAGQLYKSNRVNLRQRQRWTNIFSISDGRYLQLCNAVLTVATALSEA